MESFTIPPLSSEVIVTALLILGLRIGGMAMSTVRVLFMMRGRKLITAITGFLEVFLYIIAIGAVVNNLSNLWNVLAYSIGFVGGTLVGMWIDDKMATGFANVRIISRYMPQKIVEMIHEEGFGATVGWGHGRGGTVGMILAIVRRKEVNALLDLVEKTDPEAFITVEDARSVKRGYLSIGRQQK